MRKVYPGKIDHGIIAMAVGRIFKRRWKLPDGTIKESPNYSIAYWFHGRERVESAKTDSETKAKALLRRRLEEIGKGAYALRQEKFYYSQMVELIKADYKRKGNRSWEDVKHKIKPLGVSFEFTRSADIDLAKINQHVDRRIEEKAAIARSMASCATSGACSGSLASSERSAQRR